MWICPKCGESIGDQFDSCWKCAAGGVEYTPDGTAVVDIPMSTAPSLPNYKIKKVVGIVAGEAIMGANVISDVFAGITDIVGGRSGAYENRLREGRQLALIEMAQEAKYLGGNGVIGIDIDYETIRGTMLMITASGTAVIVEPEEAP